MDAMDGKEYATGTSLCGRYPHARDISGNYVSGSTEISYRASDVGVEVYIVEITFKYALI